MLLVLVLFCFGKQGRRHKVNTHDVHRCPLEGTRTVYIRVPYRSRASHAKPLANTNDVHTNPYFIVGIKTMYT